MFVFLKNFIATSALGVFFILGFSSNAIAGTSSIVMDIETGKILSQDNANKVRYPASMTKVMTLYLTFNALEKGIIKMEDELPVSQKAWNVAPSKLGMEVGSTITVEDAIKGLIVKSANDCAVVLAEALGYSEENFALTMTKAAHELGMENTTFKNAHGLPNKEHVSTAKDMAILAAATYSHFPQYYHLFSTEEFRYNNINYKTTNDLLGTFEGSDGLKTGYTRAAGYNIMTSAIRDGKRIVAVTMGHKTLAKRNKQMAQMMDKQLNILVASSENINKDNSSMEWAIHIGSFSNYTKAKNYAKEIQKENRSSLSSKNIEVEIEEKHAAIVYKSKIITFSKEDAINICNNLKDTVSYCNVIPSKDFFVAAK